MLSIGSNWNAAFPIIWSFEFFGISTNLSESLQPIKAQPQISATLAGIEILSRPEEQKAEFSIISRLKALWNSTCLIMIEQKHHRKFAWYSVELKYNQMRNKWNFRP